MTVVQVGDRWVVQNAAGEVVSEGFERNEDAWAWLDKQDPEHLSAVDRNNRIKTAFAER